MAGVVAAATLLTNSWTLDFFSWAPSYAVLFYLPWIALWCAPLIVLQCLSNLVDGDRISEKNLTAVVWGG